MLLTYPHSLLKTPEYSTLTNIFRFVEKIITIIQQNAIVENCGKPLK